MASSFIISSLACVSTIPSSPHSSHSLSLDFMESVIYHFLFEFSLFNSFSRCFKVSIESSKGLYSILSHSVPYFSSNVMASDFLMICSLNKYCRSINISDLIAVLGSTDFVLGSVDLGFISHLHNDF
jgi:NADH:ubiquinone oxidoreductase subunit D